MRPPALGRAEIAATWRAGGGCGWELTCVVVQLTCARAFDASVRPRLLERGDFVHGCAPSHALPPLPPPELAHMQPPPRPRQAGRKRATKETTIEVRVDLDKQYQAADAATGGHAAWGGQVLTATELKASVMGTARIATGGRARRNARRRIPARGRERTRACLCFVTTEARARRSGPCLRARQALMCSTPC